MTLAGEIMRCLLKKFNFLMIAVLMFSIGFWTDSYLRRQNGSTDCACMKLKCRIVTVADNPGFIVSHPIEIFKFLTYYDELVED